MTLKELWFGLRFLARALPIALKDAWDHRHLSTEQQMERMDRQSRELEAAQEEYVRRRPGQ